MDQLTENQRHLPLDGAINLRDLGGYRSRDGRLVRWGKIYRSGHMAKLSERGQQQLVQLGISEIHDFRRPEERQRAPTPELSSTIVEGYDMSIGSVSKFWDYLFAGGMSDQRAFDLVLNSYRSCAADVIPGYRQLFSHLLRPDEGATLFHCAAGKDRTGMAAALILTALEVPRDDIIEDYMLTQKYFDSEVLMGLIEEHLRNAGANEWQRSWLVPYCAVYPEYLEAFFDSVEGHSGTVANYLERELGVGVEQRAALAERYLQYS
ncbi:MAG: tyrosine-protein phosphatase [Porticoccaceae bacterium]